MLLVREKFLIESKIKVVAIKISAVLSFRLPPLLPPPTPPMALYTCNRETGGRSPWWRYALYCVPFLAKSNFRGLQRFGPVGLDFQSFCRLHPHCRTCWRFWKNTESHGNAHNTGPMTRRCRRRRRRCCAPVYLWLNRTQSKTRVE